MEAVRALESGTPVSFVRACARFRYSYSLATPPPVLCRRRLPPPRATACVPTRARCPCGIPPAHVFPLSSPCFGPARAPPRCTRPPLTPARAVPVDSPVSAHPRAHAFPLLKNHADSTCAIPLRGSVPPPVREEADRDDDDDDDDGGDDGEGGQTGVVLRPGFSMETTQRADRTQRSALGTTGLGAPTQGAPRQGQPRFALRDNPRGRGCQSARVSLLTTAMMLMTMTTETMTARGVRPGSFCGQGSPWRQPRGPTAHSAPRWGQRG